MMLEPGGGLYHPLRPAKSFTIEAILGLGRSPAAAAALDYSSSATDMLGELNKREMFASNPGCHLLNSFHLRHLLIAEEEFRQYGQPISQLQAVSSSHLEGPSKGLKRNRQINFKKLTRDRERDSSRKGKCKRVRTIFTPEQLERLEAEFERQQYMVGPERLYLAHSLHLTEAQVKVWFQNRRIKWRKQHLELQQQRLAALKKRSASETSDDSDEEAQPRPTPKYNSNT